jgi:hypothetical protein
MAQTPSPGEIILYDACRPPLTPGDYRLDIGHEVYDGTGAGAARVDHGADALPAAGTRRLRVTGPRFRLDPMDIHSVFPPRNAEGAYARRLPMVVLRRRTLPWERSPGAGAADAPPWLALLLLEPSEATLLEPPECTVADVLDGDPANAVRGPTLSDVDAAERGRPCLGLELSLERFQAIAPTREELSLLTHVRQVSTDDKELLGQDADGWFAVVCGNRLPRAGREHIACLVSLEGHMARLPRRVPVATSAKPQKSGPFGDAGGLMNGPLGGGLRLFVLARWRFRASGERDFQGLMQGLAGQGGVGLLGASAAAGDGEPPPGTLPAGQVPLPYVDRAGEETLAWYRGPLAPAVIAREEQGPYHCADQARRLDVATGLWDLGYAAAFEVGRQLALADPRFALALMRWRRGDEQRLRRRLEARRLEQLLRDSVNDALADLDGGTLAPRLGRLLLDDLDGLVGRNMLRADPTELRDLMQEMPGLDETRLREALDLDPDALHRILDPGVLADPLADPLVADELERLTRFEPLGELDALLAEPDPGISELLVRYRRR